MTFSGSPKYENFSADQIQTLVELRLRMAGIRVVTVSDYLPYLYVNLHVIKRHTGMNVDFFTVNLDIMQGVRLDRDPSVFCTASTWQHGMSGWAGSQMIIDSIREGINSQVDEFLNDFLAENPK